MTSLEATDLAVRILGRFQGPPADAWEEVLHDIPAGVAGTALARLTREHDKRWLSIAEFLNMCRQVQPYDASNRPHVDKCDDCGNSGWVEASEWTDTSIVLANGNHPTYSQAKPCVCREGRRAEQSPAWANR